MKQLVIHTENEQEYDQLMDIMEENGWKWSGNKSPKYYDFKSRWDYPYMVYKNWFYSTSCIYDDEYEIVKFKDWIKTHNPIKPMKLPKYFCIKRDAKNPLWDKYIAWLNKKDPQRNLSGVNKYYWNAKWESWGTLDYFKKWTVELTLDQWNEVVNKTPIKKSKPTLTYKTIKVRNDGVKFEKDTIDWETIESIQKRIGEHRSIANKMQGLLTAHKNLKF